MKKVTLFIMVCLLGTVCFGRHHHGRHHHHVRHFHHGHHHHCHGSWWGRGGRNFWPGFVGGVVAGSVLHSVYSPRTVVAAPTTVVTTPTIVQQAPVVVNTQPVYQQVWVEGRYIDQVQPNGVTVRVWQPGHYQQIQVR